MPTYPSGAGGTIGSLLRAIQEERETGPLANLPGNQPSSPIRGLVQGPVFQPEAPSSARVIAVRPETTPVATPGEDLSDIIPPVPAETPITPEISTPQLSVPAPVAPRQTTPSAQPAAPRPSAASSAPSTHSPAPAPSAPASRPAPQAVSLATTIRPSSAPAPSRVTSAPSQPAPKPSPTPQSAPPQARVGGPALTTGSAAGGSALAALGRAVAPIISIASRILPAALPLALASPIIIGERQRAERAQRALAEQKAAFSGPGGRPTPINAGPTFISQAPKQNPVQRLASSIGNFFRRR